MTLFSLDKPLTSRNAFEVGVVKELGIQVTVFPFFNALC